MVLMLGASAACVTNDGVRRPEGPAEMDEEAFAMDEAAAGPAGCAAAPVERWTGTATRTQDGYPDNLSVTTTWQRVATDGCVDRYEPVGSAQYSYAIPGALCTQSLDPRQQAVGAADGALVVDRTTNPPTFTGQASTTWTVTWTCVESDGTRNEQTFAGGGRWFESTGAVVDGRIEGVAEYDVDGACGNQPAGTLCTYEWSFTES